MVNAAPSGKIKKTGPLVAGPSNRNAGSVPGFRSDHARSKRSRFITLFQAATKSCTNFSFASALA